MYPLPPPTPPLGPVPNLPPKSQHRIKPAYTGPLLPNGDPIPGGDPTSAWEAKRAEWLARTRPEGEAPPTKDPVFTERLTRLEDLLSGRKAVSSEVGKGETEVSGGGDDDGEEEDEPDGGFAVNKTPKSGQNESELRRVGEGILLAFKQGRPVRDPIPLSLVTKLLYRSWLTDGTIPPDYIPPSQSSLFPPPSPAPSSSTQTSIPPPSDVPPLPAPMAYAAALYSSAVPPSFALAHDDERVAEAARDASDTTLQHKSNNSATTRGVQPATGLQPTSNDSETNLQPNWRGASIDLGEAGKIRVGAVAGSSWRTEKDVASGSDLY